MLWETLTSLIFKPLIRTWPPFAFICKLFSSSVCISGTENWAFVATASKTSTAPKHIKLSWSSSGQQSWVPKRRGEHSTEPILMRRRQAPYFCSVIKCVSKEPHDVIQHMFETHVQNGYDYQQAHVFFWQWNLENLWMKRYMTAPVTYISMSYLFVLFEEILGTETWKRYADCKRAKEIDKGKTRRGCIHRYRETGYALQSCLRMNGCYCMEVWILLTWCQWLGV